MRTLCAWCAALVMAMAAMAAPSLAQQRGPASLGVTVETITPQTMAERGLAIPFGALVVELEAGGSAERAGVRKGDILIAVDGRRILSEADLAAELERLAGAEAARFTMIRAGRTENVAVVLHGLPQSTPAATRPYLMLDTGGHMGTIRGLAFTADADQIVSASQDKIVRVWDWRSGRTVRTIRGAAGPGEQGKILAMALSPDNKWLAIGGVMAFGQPTPVDIGAVRVFDFASGELKRVLKGHTNAVRGLVFSPNGQLLLSGSQDKSAIIWNVADGQLLRKLEGHTAEIYAVAFTADGQRAVTGGLDSTLRLWSVSEGNPIAVREHNARVRSVAVSAANGLIASGGDDGNIRLWDASTGAFLRAIESKGTQVFGLTFNPDGTLLLSGVGDLSTHRNCRVFEVATGREVVSYDGHDNIVLATAISPDGRLAATGGGNRFDIQVWQPETGKRSLDTDNKPVSLGGSGGVVFSTGFSPDSRSIYWGKIDPCPLETSCATKMGTLQWKLRLPTTGESIGRPEPIAGDDRDVARAILSAGGYDLVVRGGGTQNKPDAILDLRRENQVVASVERGQANGYRHSAFTFTRDGRVFVSGGAAGIITAYDRTGSAIATLVGHEVDIGAITPSRDGRFLLSGSGDQTVRLWSAKTWELIVTLYHGANGEWVMWTPQGFYTGSPGGGALVGWQLNNGPEKAADYVTGDQLRKTLHRPDIVERAIVLADADAAGREIYPNGFDLAALLRARPPKLTIISPAAGSWASGGYGLITVRFNSDQPIRSVDIYVTGQKIVSSLVSSAQSPTGFTNTYRVPLLEGANQISVVATNDAGSSPVTGNTLLLWHRGEGALDRRGTLHILAVGVDRYPGLPAKCGQDGKLPCDLRYAAADAQLFAHTVARQLGPIHRSTTITLLVNGPNRLQPTKANILAAVNALRSGSENDTVIVMIAAHGERTADGRYFILPTDIKRGLADKAGTGKNILEWTQIQGAVAKAPGRRLFFLDACHAGWVQAKRAYNDKIFADARAERFVVFTATGPQQLAVEDPAYGHGLFTYYLSAGIGGNAVDENDQSVHVYHLGDYLSREVSKRTSGRQEPEFYSGMGNFVLSRRIAAQ
jgi:WD40 repeat protein